jgi:hypothetical protein
LNNSDVEEIEAIDRINEEVVQGRVISKLQLASTSYTLEKKYGMVRYLYRKNIVFDVKGMPS